MIGNTENCLLVIIWKLLHLGGSTVSLVSTFDLVIEVDKHGFSRMEIGDWFC